jgi:uncharacterized MAPEG superfamily protein
MSASVSALLGFTAWTIALVLVVVLYRTFLVFTFQKKANSWTRGTVADDPAIITRFTHAHANAAENLPLVAAVILGAQAMGQGAVTDPFACYLLGARMAQSVVHIIAVNHWMVVIRATLWTVQAGILIWWLLNLAHIV